MDNGILVALTRLAALRSTTIDRETLVLFTKELADHPQPDAVIQACERLARRPRAEGEPAFPSLGNILQEARLIIRTNVLNEPPMRPQLTSRPIANAPADVTSFRERFAEAVTARITEYRRAKTDNTDVVPLYDSAAMPYIQVACADTPDPIEHCATCHDVIEGFAIAYCDGSGHLARATHRRGLPSQHCGKRADHAPHGVAHRCHCVDTNPIIRDARRRRDAASAR